MQDHTELPKYRLKVTAGPEYDKTTHQQVNVNDKTLHFESDRATVDVGVHIQDFNGYPDNSPTTSPYFSHSLHAHDQYSISCSLTPKQNVNGDDLVFGNDFDQPLRDRLPMGFNAALKTVKWAVDPSIDGDAYADKPYLYSPALATWNQFRIGGKNGTSTPKLTTEYVVEEGADGDGVESRDSLGISGNSAKARRSHFQKKEHRQSFEFEAGRTYMADFGNGYLSFSDMSIHLPGFTIPVISMVDDKLNELRYVLKNVKTGEVYLVVLFTVVFDQEQKSEQNQDLDVD
ncbi:uncharacterized protein N7469_003982 [Penicillium citrinum]|uniref:Domain of unknown function at the cortex 1 domain-containing protein n=2 Tax=Penicillium TaxID=5073 RepID=A0A9W9P3M1_PENCI|nr:uncharacterized protein N7469_003982 [Penicillium citrinum]KAJ5234814.1 hypothetical protein N7469_003982 [Penicillium citrinum]KAJ5590434.1 hypothetical protein N7450_004406 [Penicillium hetheringtonii]